MKNTAQVARGTKEKQLPAKLMGLGLPANKATKIAKEVLNYLKTLPRPQAWQKIAQKILARQTNFAIHKLLYETVYPDCGKIPRPAWIPNKTLIKKTHIAQLMQKLKCVQYEKFQRWSHNHYADFWQLMAKQLNIVFDNPYKQVVDIAKTIESPQWFKGAKLNIANSCFNAKKTDVAIIYQAEKGALKTITYQQLNALSNQVANSLPRYLKPHEKAAIVMPMTPEAVAIYLGIIKAGGCVVSIAESFAVEEISERIKIADAKLVFTQDKLIRDGKILPLYEKIIQAKAPKAIVLPAKKTLSQKLRKQDLSWKVFLSKNKTFSPIACNPDDETNILFSSGTTGEPKAIPWTHTTPIKCAGDGYLHHNIEPKDIVCWPTSLGWMMGPWLIYASLINRATIAIYGGAPMEKSFGAFVQNAKVNILGVVPTIVKTWRNSACMEGLDWGSIKLFSSTGECSNVDDMLYLMSLANYQPIIEYCGGTEIGGAYITSTLLQPSAPAAFTSKALGLDLVILDEKGALTHKGEVALIPPSIGLSTRLLNKDHHQVYYKDMPKLTAKKILRRHGDGIERCKNGFYRLQGRVDDTMNLGGIKVSSVEIERALINVHSIKEAAAIAINPKGGGPSQLVIYVVPQPTKKINKEQLKNELQAAIKKFLNPLFKIYDLVLVDALPKTISNKIMRRVLKNEYQKI